MVSCFVSFSFLVLVSAGSLEAGISKVDVGGFWQDGPYWQTGKYTYRLTQSGDKISSEGSFGHADGYFTSSTAFVLKWSSKEMVGRLEADTIIWNDQNIWTYRGLRTEVSEMIDLSAGESDGKDNRDCNRVKCGSITIRYIPFSGPHGLIKRKGSVVEYFYENKQYSRWEGCPDVLHHVGDVGPFPRWDCPYYAGFDNEDVKMEAGGAGWRISVRFRNWADHPRKGRLRVVYWAYIG
jgi:hypothetical protein